MRKVLKQISLVACGYNALLPYHVQVEAYIVFSAVFQRVLPRTMCEEQHQTSCSIPVTKKCLVVMCSQFALYAAQN